MTQVCTIYTNTNVRFYTTQKRTEAMALLCLSDRGWHGIKEVQDFCKPPTVNCEVSFINTTIDSMIKHGDCMARGMGREMTIRQGKMREQYWRFGVRDMKVGVKLARKPAELLLSQGVLPPLPEMLNLLVHAVKGNVDESYEQPVAWVVAKWFRMQLNPHFWWIRGFFEESRLRYFPAAEANDSTRILCKALAVEMLSDRAKVPPPEILACGGDTLVNWIKQSLGAILRKKLNSSMSEALRNWAVRNGMAPEYTTARSLSWWYWVCERIDWVWVANKLEDELVRHEHRRGFRARELMAGLPIEHVEAKLNGFIGTLEDEFMKLTPDK